MATASATLCKSVGVSWDNEEVDGKVTNPEEDATPSYDGAEAEIAATVDVITGVEDDMGLLGTLVLL